MKGMFRHAARRPEEDVSEEVKEVVLCKHASTGAGEGTERAGGFFCLSALFLCYAAPNLVSAQQCSLQRLQELQL